MVLHVAAPKKSSAPETSKASAAERAPKTVAKVRKLKALASKPRVKAQAATKALVVRGAKNEAIARSAKDDGASRTPKNEAPGRAPKTEAAVKTPKVDSAGRTSKPAAPSKETKPRNVGPSQPGASPRETLATRSSGLQRADDRPLTKDERLQLAEAVRLGEDARRNAEGALASYGRWLLVNVFDDDASEALTNKRKNPVWRELLNLSDGPKLRISRTSLHLAVQVAAYDKRLNDEAFRGLDISRKRILLPLGDDQMIRDGAHHVTATKLTAAATQEYVQAMLAQNAEPRLVRMTPKAAGARVSRASKLFTDKATFGKWKNRLAELSGAPKTEAQTQLEAIAKAVQELLKALSD